MNNRPTILLFDGSNILYKTFYANKNEDVETVTGLAHHAALTTLNKYFKLYKPDITAVAFDRSNWRKDYTKSSQCLSKKLYKGNRRLTMTDKERERFEVFMEHVNEFEDILREQTGVVTLAGDKLEADDLIAGTVELFHDTHNIIIISADKDMMQLLRFPSVVLIDPSTGKPRTLVEYEMNADLFMFIKCIRGDTGDNVQSAFPRVRMTRIKQAFEDPYERTNLMEETWSDQNEQTFIVKELFAENELLMDLMKQPTAIRRQILENVDAAFESPGSFSMFHFLKFCGKHELKNISASIEQFAKMLS